MKGLRIILPEPDSHVRGEMLDFNNELIHLVPDTDQAYLVTTIVALRSGVVGALRAHRCVVWKSILDGGPERATTHGRSTICPQPHFQLLLHLAPVRAPE